MAELPKEKAFGALGFFILTRQKVKGNVDNILNERINKRRYLPMNMAITVSQVLRSKGHGFFAISPQATAYEALEIMADRDVGALLVIDEGKLVGIFSERDYARKVILKGKSSKSTTVAELMSSPPICAGPELTLQDCMVLMTSNHIRHLPVLDKGLLTGVVSIGDVVQAVISEQETTIQTLENYITGNEYGARIAVS
ncbi:MAG: CBS domain-containing protein [Nitrospirota bacterium]